MAHFASNMWPSDYGPILYNNNTASQLSSYTITGTTTASTKTSLVDNEGVSSVTFYVTTPGIYRINMNVQNTSASAYGSGVFTILGNGPFVTAGTITSNVEFARGPVAAIAVNSYHSLTGTFRVFKSDLSPVALKFTWGASTAFAADLAGAWTFTLEKIASN